jgi:hypothetical protein
MNAVNFLREPEITIIQALLCSTDEHGRAALYIMLLLFPAILWAFSEALGRWRVGAAHG